MDSCILSIHSNCMSPLSNRRHPLRPLHSHVEQVMNPHVDQLMNPHVDKLMNPMMARSIPHPLAGRFPIQSRLQIPVPVLRWTEDSIREVKPSWQQSHVSPANSNRLSSSNRGCKTRSRERDSDVHRRCLWIRLMFLTLRPSQAR